MRNTILATLVVLGLSAVAYGATNPATPAAPATAAAQPTTTTNVDAKTADCQMQAKKKGLKGTAHKKFVADCLKAK